jgi:hypothetical protein
MDLRHGHDAVCSKSSTTQQGLDESILKSISTELEAQLRHYVLGPA